MATSGIYTITGEWVALNSLTTITSGTLYSVQNIGGQSIIFYESSSVPDEDVKGVVLAPNEVADYEMGASTLYVKTYSNNIEISSSLIGSLNPTSQIVVWDNQ